VNQFEDTGSQSTRGKSEKYSILLKKKRPLEKRQTTQTHCHWLRETEMVGRSGRSGNTKNCETGRLQKNQISNLKQSRVIETLRGRPARGFAGRSEGRLRQGVFLETRKIRLRYRENHNIGRGETGSRVSDCNSTNGTREEPPAKNPQQKKKRPSIYHRQNQHFSKNQKRKVYKLSRIVGKGRSSGNGF